MFDINGNIAECEIRALFCFRLTASMRRCILGTLSFQQYRMNCYGNNLLLLYQELPKLCHNGSALSWANGTFADTEKASQVEFLVSICNAGAWFFFVCMSVPAHQGLGPSRAVLYFTKGLADKSLGVVKIFLQLKTQWTKLGMKNVVLISK